jgi:hypothetical protein
MTRRGRLLWSIRLASPRRAVPHRLPRSLGVFIPWVCGWMNIF